MKIIGYNSSHETSVAQYDTETKKVDFLYEEERFRRLKYWTPKGNSADLSCIHLKNIETPDLMVHCSFDRRIFDWHIDYKYMLKDRNRMIQARDEIAESQLSMERQKVILEKYKDHINLANGMEFDTESLDPSTGQEVDDYFASVVAEQLGLETTNFHYRFEHHLYHAECGYYFSPWNNTESAIAITWDGGGAKRFQHQWPDYQEVESIYRVEPNQIPLLQWQRLTNFRKLTDFHKNSFDVEQVQKTFAEDESMKEEETGADIIFSSHPSCGMNFSNLSHAFGFDKLGRASGKVMGAASYVDYKEYKNGLHYLSMNSVANMLQQHSFDYSCHIIRDAIERNPDCKNIILSGGYALNCTNNALYLAEFPDHNFFVDPVAHDGGTAIGGAINLAKLIEQENDNNKDT